MREKKTKTESDRDKENRGRDEERRLLDINGKWRRGREWERERGWREKEREIERIFVRSTHKLIND